jgi:SAM-dependent methyltransferase
VTDIDPRFLQSLRGENVEVCRHNVANDEVPDAAFDLIHIRLVLIHVPEREKALGRLVKALKPGGWLVDKEFDSESLQPDRNANPDEVLLKTQAAILRLMADRGAETRCGRLMHIQMRSHGPVDVEAEGRLLIWRSGSAGASLLLANFEQLRGALISGGYITQQDLDGDIAGLNDAEFMAPSPILWSAWGRRPCA